MGETAFETGEYGSKRPDSGELYIAAVKDVYFSLYKAAF